MKSLRLFIFLLPFVYFPLANQQYELIKLVWFFIVGVGVWGIERAYQVWRYKTVSIKVFSKHKLWWGLLGLYGLYLVLQTLFIALSPEVSFWGTYQRHGGLLLFLALACFFILVVTYPWSEKDRSKIFNTIIASGAGVSILALVQKTLSLALTHLPLGENIRGILSPVGDLSFTMGRTFATMGHPNFLGQFLLVSLIITVGFSLVKRTFKEPKYVLAMTLQALALLTTWNRASIITLSFVGLVWGSYWLYRKSAKKLKVLILLLGLGLISLTTWTFYQIDSRSVVTRLKIYPAVTEMIGDRPLTGYGLESFGYAFTPYLPTGLGETENFTDLPDKAHNELLDILTEQGIVGLLFVVVLGVMMLFFVCSTKNNRPMSLVLLTALVSSELTNLAGFSVITHRVYFVLLLGLLVVILFQSDSTANNKKTVLVAPLIAVSSFVFLVLGLRFVSSDILYGQYKKTSSVNLYELSLKLSPFPYEYILFGPIDVSTLARSHLQSIYATNKYDIYTHFARATVAKANGNLDAASKALADAALYCPNCPEVVSRQAMLAYEQNDTSAFLKYYEQYIQLLPRFVFEKKESLDTVTANRQRIFLKEQKNTIRSLMNIAESLSELSLAQQVLLENVK